MWNELHALPLPAPCQPMPPKLGWKQTLEYGSFNTMLQIFWSWCSNPKWKYNDCLWEWFYALTGCVNYLDASHPGWPASCTTFSSPPMLPSSVAGCCCNTILRLFNRPTASAFFQPPLRMLPRCPAIDVAFAFFVHSWIILKLISSNRNSLGYHARNQPAARDHDNVHDDMNMYVIMHDQCLFIAMINSFHTWSIAFHSMNSTFMHEPVWTMIITIYVHSLGYEHWS